MNFVVRIVVSFCAVMALVLIPLIGVWLLGLQNIFGIYIPYAALVIFFGGLIVRVIGWSRSPVPFRIPTTAGQQKSLPWIKQSKIDNPSTTLGVIVSMVFEVLTFRSLFRNTRMQRIERMTVDRIDPTIGYRTGNMIKACWICNSVKGNFFSYSQTKSFMPGIIAELQNEVARQTKYLL